VIKVVLVDDHAVVRSGLRLLLNAQDDVEVIGEAGNAKDAVFRARALKPDVILLDVVMPGESGIEVLPTLLKPTRSQSASGRSYDSSRSAIRTMRSRRSCTSRCARRSRTVRTSCRSSDSRRAPSWSATRSRTGC
jgi:DNA-binding NarL/FixJ family response regulator